MFTRAGSPLRQWLLSAVIAVGLIAMHHVVAGPIGMSATEHHTGSTMTGLTTGTATTVSVSDEGAMVPAVPVPGETASDPGCLDCGAMMGHLCLAVLVALATLIVALGLFTIAPSLASLLPPITPGRGTLPARSPPASAVRLSQLGVLRN